MKFPLTHPLLESGNSMTICKQRGVGSQNEPFPSVHLNCANKQNFKQSDVQLEQYI